jgi:hypothetical protein
MINPNCPICHGLAWVCENHPHLAWTSDPGGCECGAGMPCECQHSDDVDAGIEEPDVSGVNRRHYQCRDLGQLGLARNDILRCLFWDLYFRT